MSVQQPAILLIRIGDVFGEASAFPVWQQCVQQLGAALSRLPSSSSAAGWAAVTCVYIGGGKQGVCVGVGWVGSILAVNNSFSNVQGSWTSSGDEHSRPLFPGLGRLADLFWRCVSHFCVWPQPVWFRGRPVWLRRGGRHRGGGRQRAACIIDRGWRLLTGVKLAARGEVGAAAQAAAAVCVGTSLPCVTVLLTV